MIYNFDQNNSGGYYAKPAQNIIVKDARDEKHAIEIALAAGMYFDGVADGMDCNCCGDRWVPMAQEYDSVELAVADADRSFIDDHWDIPKYVIVEQYEKPHTATDIMTRAGSPDKYFQVGEDHFGISQSKGNWRVRGSNYDNPTI
jgi:hypothetical protein